jgi:hypothetical protein
MPVASGVPTIRWDVAVQVAWPDGPSEWVACGHRHYGADGAVKCALKYDRVAIVMRALVSSQYGVHKVLFSKKALVLSRVDMPDTTRVISPEQYAVEYKARAAAEEVKGMLK